MIGAPPDGVFVPPELETAPAQAAVSARSARVALRKRIWRQELTVGTVAASAEWAKDEQGQVRTDRPSWRERAVRGELARSREWRRLLLHDAPAACRDPGGCRRPIGLRQGSPIDGHGD